MRICSGPRRLKNVAEEAVDSYTESDEEREEGEEGKDDVGEDRDDAARHGLLRRSELKTLSCSRRREFAGTFSVYSLGQNA